MKSALTSEWKVVEDDYEREGKGNSGEVIKYTQFMLTVTTGIAHSMCAHCC